MVTFHLGSNKCQKWSWNTRTLVNSTNLTPQQILYFKVKVKVQPFTELSHSRLFQWPVSPRWPRITSTWEAFEMGNKPGGCFWTTWSCSGHYGTAQRQAGSSSRDVQFNCSTCIVLGSYQPNWKQTFFITKKTQHFRIQYLFFPSPENLNSPSSLTLYAFTHQNPAACRETKPYKRVIVHLPAWTDSCSLLERMK